LLKQSINRLAWLVLGWHISLYVASHLDQLNPAKTMATHLENPEKSRSMKDGEKQVAENAKKWEKSVKILPEV